MSFPSIFHEAALEYASRGWAVFPLIPRDKRPLIPQSRPGANDGGFHLATTDAAQIDAWWRATPHANIGLRCGAASGVFVLDLDNAGAEAALRLLAQHAERDLPDTLSQRTGKGRHLVFAHTDGVTRRLGNYLLGGKRIPCPGFDVCGEGGYVILPPSVHPNGRIYAWDDVGAPIADAPPWLLEAVLAPPPKPAAPLAPYKGDGRATAYGEKALDSATRRIATALPGSRHVTLAGEAASIGELVAGGEIERGYAERALVTAATAMMGGQITQRELSKISWGLTIGQTRPRKITRAERQAQTRLAPESRATPAAAGAPRGMMRVSPPFDDPHAVLLVTTADCADAALAAWRADGGGAFGLFVLDELKHLTGGLAQNAGGFADWRLPRPALDAPAVTIAWGGRVLIVLPGDLEGFTVSEGTKWERFISVERQIQVIGVLTQHWWREAGARDVKLAVLGDESEAAA